MIAAQSTVKHGTSFSGVAPGMGNPGPVGTARRKGVSVDQEGDPL